jgi:hypothetical protein
MKRLRKVLRKPHGQVLLATLLFCFIFTVLFAGLYHAGLLYSAKTRCARGADLTVLSGGAVYCNGLQWVRYANAVIILAAAIDVAKMATAALAAGVASGGLAAAGAAREADTLKLRRVAQDAFDPLFGVEKPTGLYPLWIFYETRQAAKQNDLATSLGDKGLDQVVPLPPVLLFSMKTRGLDALVPNMNLKFRTIGDLLDDLEDAVDKEPLYVTCQGSVTLTASQVQPCERAHPDEMCVKKGTPIYGGKYCRLIPGENAGSLSKTGYLKPIMDKTKWALHILKPLLDNIKLDIGHRTKPPDHTLFLYDFLKFHDDKLHQTAEAKIEGPGLAAWNLASGPFRTKLVSEEFDCLPVVGSLIRQCPGGLDTHWDHTLSLPQGGDIAPSGP